MAVQRTKTVKLKEAKGISAPTADTTSVFDWACPWKVGALTCVIVTLYSHTLYSHTLYSHTLYSHTLYSN